MLLWDIWDKKLLPHTVFHYPRISLIILFIFVILNKPNALLLFPHHNIYTWEVLMSTPKLCPKILTSPTVLSSQSSSITSGSKSYKQAKVQGWDSANHVWATDEVCCKVVCHNQLPKWTQIWIFVLNANLKRTFKGSAQLFSSSTIKITWAYSSPLSSNSTSNKNQWILGFFSLTNAFPLHTQYKPLSLALHLGFCVRYFSVWDIRTW